MSEKNICILLCWKLTSLRFRASCGGLPANQRYIDVYYRVHQFQPRARALHYCLPSAPRSLDSPPDRIPMMPFPSQRPLPTLPHTLRRRFPNPPLDQGPHSPSSSMHTEEDRTRPSAVESRMSTQVGKNNGSANSSRSAVSFPLSFVHSVAAEAEAVPAIL